MTFHGPSRVDEPHAMPITFVAADGNMHLFSKGLFADESEHVILAEVYAYSADSSGMFTDQINSGWYGFDYSLA